MKYMLLTPVTPEDFCLDTFEEVQESAQEFGCNIMLSTKITGGTIAFFVAKTKEALESMCSQVDLDGTVIGYSETYDQLVVIS